MSGHLENLRKIFLAGVRSVQPQTLIEKCVKRIESKTDGICLKILDSEQITLSADKNCHLIGFGKAVLSMALRMEQLLGPQLKSGIVSVPIGTVIPAEYQSSVLEIYPGAANNLPDEAALTTANRIKELALTLGANDILFVFISGGGSALLPLPRPPLTLTEKLQIIGNLQLKGATIEELNTVRIALSDIKGGRLTELAKNAEKVISFVISDIVNDPLHLIASGPTIEFKKTFLEPKSILEKYENWCNLPLHIQKLIEDSSCSAKEFPKNNLIFNIGNNTIAAKSCYNEAKSIGFIPIILSTKIQGDVEEICESYVKFLKTYKCEGVLKSNILFEKEGKLLEKMKESRKYNLPLLFILGGESTVRIAGSGLGGRNQELAMRMSFELWQNKDLKDIVFLSAGTDGIDGPTNAAGAFSSANVMASFLSKRTIKEFETLLNNNNSYNFYKNLENGKYHIITGLTGTNVMDLHLILVPN